MSERTLTETSALDDEPVRFMNYQFGLGHKAWRGEKLAAGCFFFWPQ